MKGRTAVFLLLSLLILYSCMTPPPRESEAPEYALLKIEALEDLSERDPEKYLEAFSILESSGSDIFLREKEFLAELAGRSIELLRHQMSAAQSTGNWHAAEMIFHSFEAIRNLQGSSLSGFSLGEGVDTPSLEGVTILRRLADSIQPGEGEAPARFYFLKALSLLFKNKVPVTLQELGYNKAEIDRYYSMALKANDFEVIRAIQLLTGESAYQLPPAPALKDMIGGVVTVYVDKGLKFEEGRAYPDRVLGSAFQVDNEGYYLTNYHVIESEVDPEYEGYSRLTIRPSLNPEARIPAEVIGWNRELDLALLRSSEKAGYTFSVSGENLPTPGDRVYAIGSPVGLENSITSGIVSSMGRKILGRGESIQIDAPVNPGNSGGPLINEQGEVLGIVFAGLSGFQGLNFALPNSWVLPILPRLFEKGEVHLPWIGIAAAKNLDGSLQVSYVYPGVQGFQKEDILRAIDGQEVKSLEDAQLLVCAMPESSLCRISLLRDGRELTVLKKLWESPPEPIRQALGKDTVENLFMGVMGIAADHIDGPRGNDGNYKIRKVWPGLPADEAGVSEGDTLKLLRFLPDPDNEVVILDLQVKSPTKGYLQKAFRLIIAMEQGGFL